MNEIIDVTGVENTIAEQNVLLDIEQKQKLIEAGHLSMVLETNPETLQVYLRENEKTGKYMVNETLFINKFNELFTIYAHQNTGGQWFYDDKTGLWSDLDVDPKTFGEHIYSMFLEPMFNVTMSRVDYNSEMATTLKRLAKSIAVVVKGRGANTGLGQYSNDGLVLFNDGNVYDFDEQDIRPVRKEDYMTKRFEYPIIKNEDGGSIKEWLDFVLEDSAQAFYEYVGSAFIQRPIYNVFAFAVNGLVDENTASNGGNGKSEVLNFLAKHLFGYDNVASLPLEDLIQADDKKIISLYQKFLNIDAETPETFINDTSKLKGLTGTGVRTVDRKYKTTIQMENKAKLLFATNSVPEFRDDSSAMERRLMIIPFNRDFKGKDAEQGKAFYTKELKELRQSPEELGKFAYYCINEFAKLYSKHGASANNPFSMSETAIKLRDKTIADNNPAVSFINDCPFLEFTDNPENRVEQTLVYQLYSVSGIGDTRKLVSKATFKKYLANHIANGDKQVKSTDFAPFGAKAGKAYERIRLVKPTIDDPLEQTKYKEVIMQRFQNTDYVNIFDVLPIIESEDQ